MKQFRRWGILALTLVALTFSAIRGMRAKHFSNSGFMGKSISLGRVIRPPDDIDAMAIQGNLIWAGGKEGVFGLDRLSGKVMTELACDSPLSYVTALLVDQAGSLWIGHENGLSHYDGRNCRTYREQDGLPDNRITGLYQDRQGRLWVGTWKGAAVREGLKWRVLTAADGLADDMVRVIYEDRYGGMWFGSYVAPRGGLSICEGIQCRHFSTANGLPHNNITAIVEDRDGTVWAGMGLLNRGGAVQFARAETGWTIKKVLTSSDGLAGEKVRSIFQDRDGVLWFGSENAGLARLDSGRWRTFSESDGLSNPEIKAMVQDIDGNLWLGTRHGITLVSEKTLRELHSN
jgi:ligand-binding sensor domain-containing protein